MSTELKTAQKVSFALPKLKGLKVGIVVAEWNSHITNALRDGALAVFAREGYPMEDILVKYVPGSVELTFGASCLIQDTDVDAVIVFGSVIRGGTPHFDYVCSSVTQGITALNAQGDVPVIFGVLTTDNEEQALERAGGALGNKGSEAAEAAIKMVDFARNLRK